MTTIDEFLNKEQSDWSESILDDLIQNKLHNRKEWKQIEFKMGASDIHITIAAFTYSKSGLILLGINDSGEKKGTSKVRQEVSRAIASCLDPPPNDYDVFEISLPGSTRKICVIRVIRDEDSPSSYKQQYYRREGESNIPLSKGENNDISMRARDTRDYSTKPIRSAVYADYIDKERLADYIQRYEVRQKKKILASKEDFLKHSCHAIERIQEVDVFNAAGVLFFSKEPQFFIPHSKVHCIKYLGEDVTSEILDRLDCEGNLLEIIESSIAFVKRNISKGGVIAEATTKYTWEYPDITFREAIINSVSHRDYTLENLDVQVFIFNNRIEIISPGNFPKDSLENNLPLKHFPRNPLIAQLLEDCGYGDRTGSGVKKIIREMKDLKRKPPLFKDGDNRARVTLWGRDVLLDEKMEKLGLTISQKKIVEIAKSKGDITTSQYSDISGISKYKARLQLEKLVTLDILKKQGSGPAARYILSNI